MTSETEFAHLLPTYAFALVPHGIGAGQKHRELPYVTLVRLMRSEERRKASRVPGLTDQERYRLAEQTFNARLKASQEDLRRFNVASRRCFLYILYRHRTRKNA